MKKIYLLATALAALVSCSSDDFVGDASPTPGAEEVGEAILFDFDIQKTTRADQVGSYAATTLQNQFIVYGTKHTSAETEAATNDKVVFQNYVVEYTANSAGKTTSNTHNWEYVGITPYEVAKVKPTVSSQGIKYWDYSAAQGYTFYGIASKEDITAGHVTVEKTTTGSTVYDKGYSIKLDKDANLNNLYVSDRLPVAKGDYNKPVTLSFRNFGARVRVGFYETVPGYTVTINKFYYDDNATAAVTTFGAMDKANESNFAASLQNIKTNPTGTNTLAVTYYNGTNGPENQVKLAASTVEYNYSLTLGAGVVNTVLATSSATPTWDQTSGAYTTVYPLEANNNPMLLKIDYTLTPEDESDGVIVVKGANVVVPTQYVKWKSNFAYTYLFKISDNTNGTTGDPTTTDPKGLFPITFDAVTVAVADDKTQETITTVADYSVTTYTNGSKVTVDNEYKKNQDIYVVMTNNSTGAVVAPNAIGYDANNKAQIYRATTTGTEAIDEATVFANLTGSPNGITLTATTGDEVATLQQYAPAADGTNFDFGENGAVKFKATDDGTFVYVKIIEKYVAPTYTKVGEGGTSGDWSGSTTYYFKTSEDVYYAAGGINEGNFADNKANLYVIKSGDEGTAGVYAIKVIKVVD